MSACGTVNKDAHHFDRVRVAATNAQPDYLPDYLFDCLPDCSQRDSRPVAVNPPAADSATATTRSAAPAPASSHHSTTDRAGTSTATTDRHARLHSSVAAATDLFLQASGRTADPSRSIAVRPEADDN